MYIKVIKKIVSSKKISKNLKKLYKTFIKKIKKIFDLFTSFKWVKFNFRRTQKSFK